MTTAKKHSNLDANVFAIHGAEPEVLAYAMAKYSRSSLSMKESIAEISSQKAEQFLNTFYFQYGHRSIADLAHIPMAIEDISLLAAIEVVDEQRWDGQERSTRYQDFSKRKFYTPASLVGPVAELHYAEAINSLFDGYESVFAGAVKQLKFENPKPEGMAGDAYERTVRARAFDIARYLLPMATLTSVGQITSARTLEGQISRMKASPYLEVRCLADKVQQAAVEKPAFNPKHAAAEKFHYEISGQLTDTESKALYDLTMNPMQAAPTLVKHAETDSYRDRVAKYVKTAVKELEDRNAVRMTSSEVVTGYYGLDFDMEIAATLLYEHSNYPYRSILSALASMTPIWRADLIAGVLKLRGKHDELPRAFRAGSGVTFDIHMDIGGMRDMHRHRRCTQIFQGYTCESFMAPELPVIQDLYTEYTFTARKNYEILRYLQEINGCDPAVATYLLPLGTRCRFLMKMDLAELDYIAELRTGPAGHISYRRIAWEMFRSLERIAPVLAAGIADRVTNPEAPLDFFKR